MAPPPSILHGMATFLTAQLHTLVGGQMKDLRRIVNSELYATPSYYWLCYSIDKEIAKIKAQSPRDYVLHGVLHCGCDCSLLYHPNHLFLTSSRIASWLPQNSSFHHLNFDVTQFREFGQLRTRHMECSTVGNTNPDIAGLGVSFSLLSPHICIC